jgi:dipeptidyl aminopeptidase/acylaminoacyl peptidase
MASEAVQMNGVVALAPVADLRAAYELHLSNDAVVEFLGGPPTAVPKTYDDACASKHASKVQRILVHGTADEVVPLNLSVQFMQARSLDVRRTTLVSIPGADHMELIDPESTAWPIVMEAVGELLG